MSELPHPEGALDLAGADRAPSLVRAAEPSDVPEILRLIVELATYERAASEVVATQSDLTALLFGSNTPHGAPGAYALVIDAEPGRLAGFCLWFLNASTWQGRHGIYLEDLYVRPEHRGQGHGRALMAELAAICVARGYRRLDWSVLDWNAPAIRFYDSIDAEALEEWRGRRLTGEALHALAAQAGPRSDAPRSDAPRSDAR